jgi:hypothetical protein
MVTFSGGAKSGRQLEDCRLLAGLSWRISERSRIDDAIRMAAAMELSRCRSGGCIIWVRFRIETGEHKGKKSA